MVKFQEALYEDLSLYVRQLAWLNTSPERAQIDKSTGQMAKRLSRLEQYRKANGEESFPPVPPILGEAHFYVEWLFEIGPVISNGFSPTVIPQTEIMAWQVNNDIRLQPWELKLLRRLSLDYLTEMHAAEDPRHPAPWKIGERAVMASASKNFLRELAKL